MMVVSIFAQAHRFLTDTLKLVRVCVCCSSKCLDKSSWGMKAPVVRLAFMHTLNTPVILF